MADLAGTYHSVVGSIYIAAGVANPGVKHPVNLTKTGFYAPETTGSKGSDSHGELDRACVVAPI